MASFHSASDVPMRSQVAAFAARFGLDPVVDSSLPDPESALGQVSTTMADSAFAALAWQLTGVADHGAIAHLRDLAGCAGTSEPADEVSLLTLAERVHRDVFVLLPKASRVYAYPCGDNEARGAPLLLALWPNGSFSALEFGRLANIANRRQQLLDSADAAVTTLAAPALARRCAAVRSRNLGFAIYGHGWEIGRAQFSCNVPASAVTRPVAAAPRPVAQASAADDRALVAVVSPSVVAAPAPIRNAERFPERRTALSPRALRLGKYP